MNSVRGGQQMSSDWYYAQNGQQKGPISGDALKQLAVDGQLKPIDLVWKQGMEGWVPAARIKGLATAFPAATPPTVPPTHSPPATETVATTPPIVGLLGTRTRSLPFDTDQAAAAARQIGSQAKEAAIAAGTDSFAAIRALALNPVGGLKVAFEMLGSTRSMIVGLVFAITFNLCVVIGASLLFGQIAELFMPPGRPPSFDAPPTRSVGFSEFMRFAFLGATPILSTTAGCALARKVFRGNGDLQSDLFIAGSSLLPFGLAVLLTGVVGIGNIEVIVFAVVFALTTTVLMMYSGCTTLQHIPDAAATLAVPVMIVADIYVCKVIVTSLFT
jgi:hypothetical protein